MIGARILETIQNADRTSLERLGARDFDSTGPILRFVVDGGTRINVSHDEVTDTFSVTGFSGDCSLSEEGQYFDMIVGSLDRVARGLNIGG